MPPLTENEGKSSYQVKSGILRDTWSARQVVSYAQSIYMHPRLTRQGTRQAKKEFTQSSRFAFHSNRQASILRAR